MLIGNVEIEDTFAELFQMWVSRILITAENEKWANIASNVATGLATSIIGSPAEAGIEGQVSPENTPDGRFGSLIQIYHRNRRDLKRQMILSGTFVVLIVETLKKINRKLVDSYFVKNRILYISVITVE